MHEKDNVYCWLTVSEFKKLNEKSAMIFRVIKGKSEER